MDSLDILVKQGKVLYLGASDMPAWIVSACNEYAKYALLQSYWAQLMIQSPQQSPVRGTPNNVECNGVSLLVLSCGGS
jgi:aryl-alcohol dehydrogenase-like predicted oxidoreductase